MPTAVMSWLLRGVYSATAPEGVWTLRSFTLLKSLP